MAMFSSLRFKDRVVAPSSRPLVMGILNVTPDSFSDGGLFATPAAAVAHAVRMLSDGAAIVDVGPESTRPGSTAVDADEQRRRAIPVIQGIVEQRPEAIVSIDTRSAAVAAAGIEAGALLVNDTSALRDDREMAAVVADSNASVVLMHRRGDPADMQRDGGPHYDDVVGEIAAFFEERITFAVRAGIREDRIILDPGIGFGKRVEHNLTILAELDRLVRPVRPASDQLCRLDHPILVGASRKRFIGEITGASAPTGRLAGSLACALAAAARGAAILRVHDVGETVEALRMWAATRSSVPY